MLSRLMQDHKHIGILLSILNKKRDKLDQGESVNFNIVRDIVEYMQCYAEHSHHPLEDVIYQYSAEKWPELADLQQVRNEHVSLACSSATLMASLNLILNDVVISKAKLMQDLQQYAHEQACHMQLEEQKLFPVLRERLTVDDWDEIRIRCDVSLKDDPLFTDNGTQSFYELKTYLMHKE